MSRRRGGGGQPRSVGCRRAGAAAPADPAPPGAAPRTATRPRSTCSPTAAWRCEGRLVVASNATLYCTVSDGSREAACVYKPVAGERPLWDFPDGTLAGREVAAYAGVRGGGLEPRAADRLPRRPVRPRHVPAVDRIGRDRRRHRARPQQRPPALRQMAVFDAVVNNADRKIGHLLPDSRRAPVRLRPRGLLRRGVQAAHRALAVARPRPARSPPSRRCAGCSDALAGENWAPSFDRWLSPAEVEATRQRVELLLRAPGPPVPAGRLARRPLAAVLVSPGISLGPPAGGYAPRSPPPSAGQPPPAAPRLPGRSPRSPRRRR